MRFFAALLGSEGHGISDAERHKYESVPRARGHSFAWHSIGQGAVLVGGDEPCADLLVVTDGEHVAVGTVRLDNREELRRLSGVVGPQFDDLGLVLRVVRTHGTKYVPRMLGDFAFVVWHPKTRTGVIACDAFAVRRLYYRAEKGFIAFASRAELLAAEGTYDVEYLTRLLAMCGLGDELTVYDGVRRVAEASVGILEDAKLRFRRYWTAWDFQPETKRPAPEDEVAAICQQLFATSVRVRLGGPGETWAQLSGGMDSSSVVSTAAWLAARGDIQHGVAGTVTFVDRQGTSADERAYSDAVLQRWSLRNLSIVDPPVWYDEQYAPPQTDQPRLDLHAYPRDRRLCSTVQAEGGRVLLTGWGGDEMFTGNMLFFADWVVRGRLVPAVREILRRAAMGRVSFWELAYRSALFPLLPEPIRRGLVRDGSGSHPWLVEATMRRYGVAHGSLMASDYAGPVGRKYQHAMVMSVVGVPNLLSCGILEDSLDVRHPFLYRPLVEFALRLAPGMCARPHARKWVLREAMRGILPEEVRGRVGKASAGDVLAWSLATQRAHLEPLVKEPILADLGVVDGSKLRAAFDADPLPAHRADGLHATLSSTLSVEAWLQLRAGRWPRRTTTTAVHKQ
jgi:asparagine synthase (glutamine-hydrolysing)